MPDDPWRYSNQGISVALRVTPRGGRDDIDGVEALANGRVVLKVRVRAIAEGGEANRAVTEFFAKVLGVPKARVRILSVPNVHWTNGALVDLDRVCARAHELDAAIVLDVSQSAGAMPLDVKALCPDFLISVGYKWLFGPLGVAYMYLDERHRVGEPIEHNWINRAGSEDFAGLVEYTDDFQPGARRFDVGARTNFMLVPTAIAALEQVLEW